MQKVIVVGGPTATGKTEIASKIAENFNGELINADSRQVYKYLNIGTNKSIPKDSQNKPVKIHLIDIIDPDQTFNVFQYKELADRKINEIIAKNKIPILVGGTGLYIDAVIKNYKTSDVHENTEFREKLSKLSVIELQDKLQSLNSNALETLNKSDKSNPRRLIRLIEKNGTKLDQRNDIQYDVLFIYPKYEWGELLNKIDSRVEQMFQDGLIQETKDILRNGYSKESYGMRIMGYREVVQFLEHEFSLNECINKVKIAHRQYAKRQRTWFEGEGRGYNLTQTSLASLPYDQITHFLEK